MSGRSAGLLLRVVAKSIDLVLAFAAAEALVKTGWVVGLGYVLISDGLFDGRSVGKRLTGLRVLGASGERCSIRESILRNSTVALGLLLWRIPYLGWPLLAAVLALEFVVLLGSKEGMRLGDEIAKTSVVEAEAEDRRADGAS
jgi:uncharacterized RDD family membrane protein YckC